MCSANKEKQNDIKCFVLSCVHSIFRTLTAEWSCRAIFDAFGRIVIAHGIVWWQHFHDGFKCQRKDNLMKIYFDAFHLIFLYEIYL